MLRTLTIEVVSLARKQQEGEEWLDVKSAGMNMINPLRSRCLGRIMCSTVLNAPFINWLRHVLIANAGSWGMESKPKGRSIVVPTAQVKKASRA
jgi:hypothetical protein